MNLKTRFNLWKLKRSMKPSVVFKAALRKDLGAAWDAKYGNKAPWYQLGMHHAAASFTAITLILTGAGGVYAYNSPEVTEGSVLYPVKQAIETVEEVTKVTPEAKAKFYLKKIERRQAERKALERENKISEQDLEENIIVEENTTSTIGENEDENIPERRIKRIKKSIEATEDQLEKTRQVIEETESKDIELRKELKNRAEQRLERIKKQLEIKAEKQKERQENSQRLKFNNSIKIEERSQIKIEELD